MKRRSFIKGAVLTTAAAAAGAPLILTSRKTAAQVVIPPSPPTTPWVQYLPDAITPLSPVATPLDPAPTIAANIADGEIGRAEHQRFVELTAPGVCGAPQQFQLTAMENPGWVFNPAYLAQPIWGYAGPTGDATTPGPTIFARYGQSIICRIYNGLPPNHVGFGTPEISTHLHNLHTPSESDGFPGDFYSATQRGPTLTAPGRFNDHFYPNIYAGFDTFGGIGDPREALGTLWYHDHTMDFTSPNIYRGLAGFYLIFDDLDTGNEQTGLRLPSHPYDYPILLQDRRFDPSGILFFDQFNPEGILGDKITVNGKIEPVLKVARRKYRFRLLNGGPSRFYELYLQNKAASAVYTFKYIANDGNLLPNPLTQFKVRLAPAERGDIVIDFAKFPLGTELYLVNQLLQIDTRGPGNVKAPGTRLLKLVVDRNPPAPDASVVPNVLRALPDIPTDFTGVPVRNWVFARSGGMWTVNNQLFNVNVPRALVRRSNVGEIWELVNPENGWFHPIHIHFEEGRIIGKAVNGVSVPIPLHERGRKDVYVLGKDETLRVFIRFRDFLGKYPMHCHNLIHEDHAMMIRFDIVPS